MGSTGDELKLRAHQVCAPAQAVLEAIFRKIQASDVDVFYAVRSRAKTVRATINKVERKREEGKVDYEPESVTDIVGIRIVTLFREDLIDALRVFLRMILHEGIYEGTSPFQKGALNEAIIYTTAPIGDPEAITSRLISVFETLGFPIKDADVRRMETGYSSVHLVVNGQVAHDKELLKVPVEIQIRTVFEDAWGEIDHKLRYSLNRTRPGAANEIESWQPHLNVLKTFTDGCGQYAGVIKSQAINPSLRPQFQMAPFILVDSANDILKQLGRVSPKFESALRDAYKARSAADVMRKQNRGRAGDPYREAFLEAAAKFEAICALTGTEQFEKDGRETAYFLCTMERAFCLLSSDDKSAIDTAIQLYKEMQDRSPNSVIIYYRYAQALSRLGEFETATQKYKKAEDLLERDKYVPEHHWLRWGVPIQGGYLLWTQSLACDPSEPDGRATRVHLLKQAYDRTLKAFERAEPGSNRATRTANNLLYYGVSYCGFVPAEKQEIRRDELEKFLKLVEAALDVGNAEFKDLSWLDTLCRAYAQFGDTEKAMLAAQRIEAILPAVAPNGDGAGEGPAAHGDQGELSYYDIVGNLNARERDIMDHALWVLRPQKNGA